MVVQMKAFVQVFPQPLENVLLTTTTSAKYVMLYNPF